MFYSINVQKVLQNLPEAENHIFASDETFGLESLQPDVIKAYDTLAGLYADSHLLNLLADKPTLDNAATDSQPTLRSKQARIQHYLNTLKQVEQRKQQSETLAQQTPRPNTPISERAEVHLNHITDEMQRTGKCSHLTLEGLVNAYYVLQRLENLLVSFKAEVRHLPAWYQVIRKIPESFLKHYELHIDQQQALLQTEYQALAEAMFQRLKTCSDNHNLILNSQLDEDIQQLNRLGVAVKPITKTQSPQLFQEDTFIVFHRVIQQHSDDVTKQGLSQLRWFMPHDAMLEQTLWQWLGKPKPRFAGFLKGRAIQHEHANHLYKRAYLACAKTTILKDLSNCEITINDLRNVSHTLQKVERLWQFEWQKTQQAVSSLSGWRRFFTRQTQQLLKRQVVYLQRSATKLIEARVAITDRLTHALDQQLLRDIRHSDERELLLSFIDVPASLPRTAAFDAIIKQTKQALIKSTDNALERIDQTERLKAREATEAGLLSPFSQGTLVATEADAMALLTYVSHLPTTPTHPFVKRVHDLLPKLRTSLSKAFSALADVTLSSQHLRQVTDDLIAKIELLTVWGTEDDKQYFEHQFHQLACQYVSRWSRLNINESTTLEQHHHLSEQQEAILLRYATTQQQDLIVPLKTLRQESQLPSCSHRLIELERRCIEIDAVWVCELIDAQFKAEALAYEDALFRQLTKYTQPALDELTIAHLRELRDKLLAEQQYDVNKAPAHCFSNADAVLLQLPHLQEQQSLWSRVVNRSEYQQAEQVRLILNCSLLLRQALQQLPLLKTKPEKIKLIDKLHHTLEPLLKTHTQHNHTLINRLQEQTLFKRNCKQEAQSSESKTLLSLPHLVS